MAHDKLCRDMQNRSSISYSNIVLGNIIWVRNNYWATQTVVILYYGRKIQNHCLIKPTCCVSIPALRNLSLCVMWPTLTTTAKLFFTDSCPIFCSISFFLRLLCSLLTPVLMFILPAPSFSLVLGYINPGGLRANIKEIHNLSAKPISTARHRLLHTNLLSISLTFLCSSDTVCSLYAHTSGLKHR